MQCGLLSIWVIPLHLLAAVGGQTRPVKILDGGLMQSRIGNEPSKKTRHLASSSSPGFGCSLQSWELCQTEASCTALGDQMSWICQTRMVPVTDGPGGFGGGTTTTTPDDAWEKIPSWEDDEGWVDDGATWPLPSIDWEEPLVEQEFCRCRHCDSFDLTACRSPESCAALGEDFVFRSANEEFGLPGACVECSSQEPSKCPTEALCKATSPMADWKCHALEAEDIEMSVAEVCACGLCVDWDSSWCNATQCEMLGADFMWSEPEQLCVRCSTDWPEECTELMCENIGGSFLLNSCRFCSELDLQACVDEDSCTKAKPGARFVYDDWDHEMAHGTCRSCNIDDPSACVTEGECKILIFGYPGGGVMWFSELGKCGKCNRDNLEGCLTPEVCQAANADAKFICDANNQQKCICGVCDPSSGHDEFATFCTQEQCGKMARTLNMELDQCNQGGCLIWDGYKCRKCTPTSSEDCASEESCKAVNPKASFIRDGPAASCRECTIDDTESCISTEMCTALGIQFPRHGITWNPHRGKCQKCGIGSPRGCWTEDSCLALGDELSFVCKSEHEGDCVCGTCDVNSLDACGAIDCAALPSTEELTFVWSERDQSCGRCGPDDPRGCGEDDCATVGGTWICARALGNSCQCRTCDQADVAACTEPQCMEMRDTYPGMMFSYKGDLCVACNRYNHLGCTDKASCEDNDFFWTRDMGTPRCVHVELNHGTEGISDISDLSDIARLAESVMYEETYNWMYIETLYLMGLMGAESLCAIVNQVNLCQVSPLGSCQAPCSSLEKGWCSLDPQGVAGALDSIDSIHDLAPLFVKLQECTMLTLDACAGDCEPGVDMIWSRRFGCVPTHTWYLDYLGTIEQGESVMAKRIMADMACMTGMLNCSSMVGCEENTPLKCGASADKINELAAAFFPTLVEQGSVCESAADEAACIEESSCSWRDNKCELRHSFTMSSILGSGSDIVSTEAFCETGPPSSELMCEQYDGCVWYGRLGCKASFKTLYKNFCGIAPTPVPPTPKPTQPSTRPRPRPRQPRPTSQPRPRPRPRPPPWQPPGAGNSPRPRPGKRPSGPGGGSTSGEVECNVNLGETEIMMMPQSCCDSTREILRISRTSQPVIPTNAVSCSSSCSRILESILEHLEWELAGEMSGDEEAPVLIAPWKAQCAEWAAENPDEAEEEVLASFVPPIELGSHKLVSSSVEDDDWTRDVYHLYADGSYQGDGTRCGQDYSYYGEIVKFSCNEKQACGTGADFSGPDYPSLPPGWQEIEAFTGNVGSRRDCADGWNAYSLMDNVGAIQTTLRGSGEATINYGDCWGMGVTVLYKNGNKIDETDQPTKMFTFSFADGDTIKLRDEGVNAVVWIGSLTFQCSQVGTIETSMQWWIHNEGWKEYAANPEDNTIRCEYKTWEYGGVDGPHRVTQTVVYEAENQLPLSQIQDQGMPGSCPSTLDEVQELGIPWMDSERRVIEERWECYEDCGPFSCKQVRTPAPETLAPALTPAPPPFWFMDTPAPEELAPDPTRAPSSAPKSKRDTAPTPKSRKRKTATARTVAPPTSKARKRKTSGKTRTSSTTRKARKTAARKSRTTKGRTRKRKGES